MFWIVEDVEHDNKNHYFNNNFLNAKENFEEYKNYII